MGEPVGEEVEQTASSKAKSSVSEMFIEKTRTALEDLMARRPLSGQPPPVERLSVAERRRDGAASISSRRDRDWGCGVAHGDIAD